MRGWRGYGHFGLEVLSALQRALRRGLVLGGGGRLEAGVDGRGARWRKLPGRLPGGCRRAEPAGDAGPPVGRTREQLVQMRCRRCGRRPWQQPKERVRALCTQLTPVHQ